MKIATIDESDFDGSTLEPLRCVQAAKAAAQYHNAMAGWHCESPSGRNPKIVSIITANVIISSLIREQRSRFWQYLGLAILAITFLQPRLMARADDRGSTASHTDSSSKT